MVQARFVEFVTDVFAYYQREKPKDRTMDLWFDEVRNIPDECLEWVLSKVFKESDRLPSNLPATMWALYNAWLQAHPEKRAHRDIIDCPDCEGGWLVLQKIVENKFGKPMYEHAIPTFTAPCGRCKQVPSKHYATLSEALAEGYERVDLRRCFWNGESIHDMTRRIGTPVPPATVY